MAEIHKRNIKRATQNIINFGDTDVFPYPFENALIRRNQDKFVELIQDVSSNFDSYFESTPPQFESSLVPVGYQGYRWATQICPFWNAYMLSAMLRHSAEIEAQRLPVGTNCVHSYRIETNEQAANIFSQEYNWRSFMTRSYELAQDCEYVVVTDISEFYRRIYHHRVENALKQACNTGLPDKLMKLLSVFSGGSSYGLPIGGPAARIISELVINQVDKLLFTKKIKFCRFSDDFHIFTDSEEGAHRAIQILSELLILNQGLTLQKSKTRILTGSEFLNTFPSHLVPGSEPKTDRERLFSLSLNYDPYSPTAEEDYEHLKDCLESIDFLALLDEELAKSQVHGPTASKLIRSLKLTSGTVRKNAIATILDNLNILYPVFTQLMIALQGIKDDLEEEEYRSICAKLIELSESDSYIMTLDIHRCFAVRILQGFSDYRVDAIFDNWYQNGSAILRRDILTSYAIDGHIYQLSDLKHKMGQSSPWERRAFIAGSYVMLDEGSHWRKAQSFSPFEKFVRDSASSLATDSELGIMF